MPTLTEAEVLDLIRIAVARAGSQAAFAHQCGVPQQFISDVLHQRRRPSDAILNVLGLRRLVRYEYKSPSE